mmetsp:Transcript_19907/g.62635  ORF Transcript_19907/g.62635 Transcript_19907/m.62635 type:complete len:240 (+) Transcript_19907:16-735(+)
MGGRRVPGGPLDRDTPRRDATTRRARRVGRRLRVDVRGLRVHAVARDAADGASRRGVGFARLGDSRDRAARSANGRADARRRVPRARVPDRLRGEVASWLFCAAVPPAAARVRQFFRDSHGRRRPLLARDDRVRDVERRRGLGRRADGAQPLGGRRAVERDLDGAHDLALRPSDGRGAATVDGRLRLPRVSGSSRARPGRRALRLGKPNVRHDPDARHESRRGRGRAPDSRRLAFLVRL